jgi:hypothetical protein
LRFDFGLVGVQEFVEFFAFIGGDDNVASGQALGSGVLGRTGLAFGSAWFGAVLGIGSIGCQACWGAGHNFDNLGSMIAGGLVCWTGDFWK